MTPREAELLAHFRAISPAAQAGILAAARAADRVERGASPLPARLLTREQDLGFQAFMLRACGRAH